MNGSTNVYCDYELVFRNSSFSESTLKNRHKAITLSWMREAITADIVPCLAVWSPESLN
jgi:hypothetical protein